MNRCFDSFVNEENLMVQSNSLLEFCSYHRGTVDLKEPVCKFFGLILAVTIK